MQRLAVSTVDVKSVDDYLAVFVDGFAFFFFAEFGHLSVPLRLHTTVRWHQSDCHKEYKFTCTATDGL